MKAAHVGEAAKHVREERLNAATAELETRRQTIEGDELRLLGD